MPPIRSSRSGPRAIEAGGSAANRIRWTLTAQQRTDLQSLDDGDRFILFITEPEAVATDHAVDAGDVSWSFDVPGVSVTLAHAYEVDAGDASWAFDIPAVTVTHVPAQPQAFARDAGDVSWAFDIPAVTVTHTTAQPQDYAVDAGDVSWSFAIPQASVTHRLPAGSIAYDQGLAIEIGGTATKPHQNTLRLLRGLADGAEVSFTVRGLRADLSHVQRGVAVTVEDAASSTLLFSGHILRADAAGTAGDGTLTDIVVEATGIEQRPYRHVLTGANARSINTAATASDQLDALVAILGTPYSAGDVHANVNRLTTAGAGSRAGALIRLLGDVQRVTPAGAIDLIMREGLAAAATVGEEHIRPTSSYAVDLDTTAGRVIATGAPVKFIASGTMEVVTESGVDRAVATITPPADTEIITVDRVIARTTITDKFTAGDMLDGVWDPDQVRFEWSGELDAADTANVEMSGTWHTELIVTAAGASPLARDATLAVPVTDESEILTAANRELRNQRDPIELLRLDLVLGAVLPRMSPGDAALVALALQRKLDVFDPDPDGIWLVHAVGLTQPAATQATVSLELSRRLPDYRDRDFWGPDEQAGTGGRQIVIGGTAASGAPRVAAVIPAQTVKVGGLVKTIDLGTYFSDPDDDTLAYVVTSGDTSVVTVPVANGVITITPVAEGTASVTVIASDANNSAAQIFTINVVLNRDPVAFQGQVSLYLAVGAMVEIEMDQWFYDPDGDDLTYSWRQSDFDHATVMRADDVLTVTRDTGDHSNYIYVEASDGIGTSNEIRFSLRDPP